MKRNSQVGFTIVELLIVVVVIAILAAVVIVAYNGVRARAEASVLENDLSTSAKQIELERNSKDGVFTPTMLTPFLSTTNNGITTKYLYGDPVSFCAEATNEKGLTYHINSASQASPTEGACPASTTSAEPRCIAGQAYVVVLQNNFSSEPLEITITTPFSTSSTTTVAAGSNKSASSDSNTTSISAGVVTVRLKGVSGSSFDKTLYQAYAAKSC